MAISTRGTPDNFRLIAQAIIRQIKLMMPELSPRQKLLADFIVRRPETVGFLPITNLARTAGVSEATVVRFCNKLGYSGYAHLGREVQQNIQYELSTLNRFNLARDIGSLANKKVTSAFERVVALEMENLANLAKVIRKDDFDQVVNWMMTASRIVIIGTMGSAALAQHFGYMASKLIERVDVITTSNVGSNRFLCELSSTTITFLLALPRYPRVTVELGRLAKSGGGKIVSITDSSISPIVPLADIVFLVPAGIVSFADAYSAPSAFLTALLAELSERDSDATQRSLGMFEDYAQHMRIFSLPDDAKKQ